MLFIDKIENCTLIWLFRTKFLIDNSFQIDNNKIKFGIRFIKISIQGKVVELIMINLAFLVVVYIIWRNEINLIIGWAYLFRLVRTRCLILYLRWFLCNCVLSSILNFFWVINIIKVSHLLINLLLRLGSLMEMQTLRISWGIIISTTFLFPLFIDYLWNLFYPTIT